MPTAYTNLASGIYTIVPEAPSGYYAMLKDVKVDHNGVGTITFRAYPSSGTLVEFYDQVDMKDVNISGVYGEAVEIQVPGRSNILCSYVYIQPEGLSREPRHSYGGQTAYADTTRRDNPHATG